ncbi:MAG: RluA family pseudouridine synthase [Nitrosotalea sp.]
MGSHVDRVPGGRQGEVGGKTVPSRGIFDVWYQDQIISYPDITHPFRRRADASRRFLDEFTKPGLVIYNDSPVSGDYKQGDILVINKPPWIHSHGNGKQPPYGIAELVQIATRNQGVFNGHRLDRDTTGVLVLGKNRNALASLNGQFDHTRGAHEVSKTYVALVEGKWVPEIAGVVAPIGRSLQARDLQRVVEPLALAHDALSGRTLQVTTDDNGESEEQAARIPEDNGKMSATGTRVLAYLTDVHGKKWTLMRIKLFTGRTHQIRVVTSYMDHPVMGDPQYNPKPEGADRQLLHSFELSLRKPRTAPQANARLTFRAPLPGDFRTVLEGMKVDKVVDDLYHEVMTA